MGDIEHREADRRVHFLAHPAPDDEGHFRHAVSLRLRAFVYLAGGPQALDGCRDHVGRPVNLLLGGETAEADAQRVCGNRGGRPSARST